MREIVGRLARERRIGRADALPATAMARRAGGESARRVAVMIEGLCCRGSTQLLPRRVVRHSGIICRHCIMLRGRQFARDHRHLGMPPPSAGISFELCSHIAPVQPGQARCARAIAAPVDPVTGDTGSARARIAPADRQQFPTRREPVRRTTLDRSAADHTEAQNEAKRAQIHRSTEPTGWGDGSGRETPVEA